MTDPRTGLSKILLATALSSTCIFATPVSAADASPLSGNVSLTTDYRFRGISQNNTRPAVQGGLDYAQGDFYVGTWASNVSWLADGGAGSVSNSIEMDFYGGWKTKAGGADLDLGLLYYYYPGAYPSGLNSPNTLEFYIGGEISGFSAKYSHSLTDLFGFSDSKGSGYIDLGYGMTVSELDLGVHLGFQRLPSATGRSSSDCSYSDWSVSAGKNWGGFDFKAAYVGTNAKGDAGECYRNSFNKDLGKGTIVLTVGKSL